MKQESFDDVYLKVISLNIFYALSSLRIAKSLQITVSISLPPISDSGMFKRLTRSPFRRVFVRAIELQNGLEDWGHYCTGLRFHRRLCHSEIFTLRPRSPYGVLDLRTPIQPFTPDSVFGKTVRQRTW
ncbi:hypothetical protein BYT27DRAFT_6835825 [Phlegmacium glaucopus]|nr:hypothetical protein BYT27DRAFT_6835825 [Phlegmacium glaucopus]